MLFRSVVRQARAALGCSVPAAGLRAVLVAVLVAVFAVVLAAAFLAGAFFAGALLAAAVLRGGDLLSRRSNSELTLPVPPTPTQQALAVRRRPVGDDLSQPVVLPVLR